ncbi:MAG TPA: DUF1559 domain-containing protein [Verrucomicrobiae bacterium]|nr:DUF1559 domain-containing protein [Verrucomicrobiae bacterium]
MNPHRRIAAFSLLELLVVIAVIGILSSLLFPVLSRAREKARQSTCVNNLRQLGAALRMYCDDHDGRIFRYRTAATNNGDIYWFGWLERGADEGTRRFDPTLGALHPYLGGPGVDLCPSLNYHLSRFKLKATGAAYGYGYNLHLSAPSAQPAYKIDDGRTPSGLAVLADAAQVNTFQPPASPERPMLEEFYYISTNEPTTHFRHQKRASVLFADCHVESLAPAAGTLDPRLPSEIVGTLAPEHLAPR